MNKIMIVADKPNKEEVFYQKAGEGRENDLIRELLDKVVGRRLSSFELVFTCLTWCEDKIKADDLRLGFTNLIHLVEIENPTYVITVGEKSATQIAGKNRDTNIFRWQCSDWERTVVCLPNRYQLHLMSKWSLNKTIEFLKKVIKL